MADPSRMLALPFRVDPTGAIAYTEDPSNQLTERVYAVLSTQPGERVMRPDYGCDLRQFDWSTYDGFLQQQVFSVMQSALGRFEPDATLSGVVVTPPDSNGVMQIQVAFKATNDAQGQTASLQLGVVAASGAIQEVTA